MSYRPYRSSRPKFSAGRRVLAGLTMLVFLLTSCAGADDSTQGDSTQSSTSETANTIVLINPNSNEDSTRSMADLAEAEADGVANVEGVSNEDAPPLLETPQDMEEAAPGVVELGVEAAEDENVAAIIVSAFSDPGLEELREEVDVPVFGIGEESFHAAAQDDRKFSIATITPDEDLVESFQERAESFGYSHLYQGVRVTPGDPDELDESPEELDAALTEAVQESISSEGAEAVIMGGGPLSEPALRIEEEFEEPLVVPVIAATDEALDVVNETE
ncbi:aspartate/glutamate racemase family protein [Natribacillus halophilus]|uniref:Asp/Glu/hydantoin racemase n=1 Tax=Natribacillus halophilus TaxID=549003 RepID=A0A1G8S0B2_9BACI|nr:aspartate/glutamate racemase family protein [Natribacillus halophilus]SDJ22225.1 Asp/Glu/hydantoin racemase [Natribacillus halophilus]